MNDVVACPFCGYAKALGPEDIPHGARAAVCPRCRHKFPLKPGNQGNEDGGASEGGAGILFSAGVESEHAVESGSVEMSFPALALALIRSPYDFFHRHEVFQNPRELFSFGMLFGSLGTMLFAFWQLGALAWGSAAPGMAPLLVGGVFMLCVALSPVWVAVSMLINTVFVHFCLLLAGAGRMGLVGTFRVVAYSQAAKTLGVIPVVGGPSAFIWQLVIQVIGLREVHGVSSLRLLLAAVSAAVLLILAAMAWYFLRCHQV
jgi:hypothetical protein